MTDLTDLGVAAIRDGVREGSFSAREVADAFVASRLAGHHGVTFGTLDADLSARHARTIIDRAFGG